VSASVQLESPVPLRHGALRGNGRTPPTSTYIRASALSQLDQLILELGGSPEAIAAEAGLAPHAAPQLVPLDLHALTLEVAARRLGCPTLGMRLGLRQSSRGVLGEMGVLVESSPTLRDALVACAEYLPSHSRGLGFEIIADGRRRVLLRVSVSRTLSDATQLWEQDLACVVRMLRDLPIRPVRPQVVRFPHRPLAPAMLYAELLGAPATFQQPHAEVVVSADDLDAPLKLNDPIIYAMARRQVEARGLDVSSEIVSLVREALSGPNVTIETELSEVARAMGVHCRTLQRKLKAERASFSTLKEEAMARRARHLLTLRDTPLQAVSEQLGFSELSAFTRSCKRWFGEPPRVIRRRRTR